MGNERYKAIVDVHMFLLRDGKVLLGRRQNTGYHDGDFHLHAGHLEADETLVDALVREAGEELGIEVHRDEARLAYILHHYSKGGRIGVFFSVPSWSGELRNMEPDKCSALEWFDINTLPSNMVPYAKFALQDFAKGESFGMYGWPFESTGVV